MIAAIERLYDDGLQRWRARAGDTTVGVSSTAA
jgi:hypothetical protein